MTLDYSRQYAKFHPNDPGHRPGLTLLHHRILGPLLPGDREAPILDVGCGAGYVLEDVRALGYMQTRGIEPNPALADAARARGQPVDMIANTSMFLQGQPGAYQVVLLMDVLEHIPRTDQPGFLRAIAGSLRPNGRLICSVPNASSAISGYWLHNDYTHQLSFTEDSLEFLLEQTGFGDVTICGPEIWVRPRFLFWLPTARSTAWWLRCLLRWRQRATYVAELGWERGRRIALTPNLLAVANKKK